MKKISISQYTERFVKSKMQSYLKIKTKIKDKKNPKQGNKYLSICLKGYVYMRILVKLGIEVFPWSAEMQLDRICLS